MIGGLLIQFKDDAIYLPSELLLLLMVVSLNLNLRESSFDFSFIFLQLNDFARTGIFC